MIEAQEMEKKDLTYIPPGGITTAPIVGDRVIRRGGPLARWFARSTMKLFGWKVEGDLPNSEKFIVIGAPHTSNWDWVLVILAAYVLGVRISWMAKHTLFKRPFGGIMRWLGGVSIDRRAKHGTVGDAINSFAKVDKLILCITPEGTRHKVQEWKKGFYYIADGANVPIVVCAFDYGKKSMRFGPVFKPSGDVDGDLPTIKSYYDGVIAKYPENSFVPLGNED